MPRVRKREKSRVVEASRKWMLKNTVKKGTQSQSRAQRRICRTERVYPKQKKPKAGRDRGFVNSSVRVGIFLSFFVFPYYIIGGFVCHDTIFAKNGKDEQNQKCDYLAKPPYKNRKITSMCLVFCESATSLLYGRFRGKCLYLFIICLYLYCIIKVTFFES